jgi:hypothetical protein
MSSNSFSIAYTELLLCSEHRKKMGPTQHRSRTSSLEAILRDYSVTSVSASGRVKLKRAPPPGLGSAQIFP